VAPCRCLAPRGPLNLRDDFSFSFAQRQPLDVAAGELVVDSGVSALLLPGGKGLRKAKKLELRDRNSAGCDFTLTIKREMNNSDYALVASGSAWSPKYQGATAAAMHDDGNGLDVTLHEGPSFRLDYAQIIELYLLMNEYVRYPRQQPNYEYHRIKKLPHGYVATKRVKR
jgi:hypothetical protein